MTENTGWRMYSTTVHEILSERCTICESARTGCGRLKHKGYYSIAFDMTIIFCGKSSKENCKEFVWLVTEWEISVTINAMISNLLVALF